MDRVSTYVDYDIKIIYNQEISPLCKFPNNVHIFYTQLELNIGIQLYSKFCGSADSVY